MYSYRTIFFSLLIAASIPQAATQAMSFSSLASYKNHLSTGLHIGAATIFAYIAYTTYMAEKDTREKRDEAWELLPKKLGNSVVESFKSDIFKQAAQESNQMYFKPSKVYLDIRATVKKQIPTVKLMRNALIDAALKNQDRCCNLKILANDCLTSLLTPDLEITKESIIPLHVKRPGQQRTVHFDDPPSSSTSPQSSSPEYSAPSPATSVIASEVD